MTRDYYVKMWDTTGTTGPAPEDDIMYVQLYPYYTTEESAVQSDGIVATAIHDAASELLNHGAIDHYTIYRWKYEDSATNYPWWGDIDDCSRQEIRENFKSWLRNNGDTDNCGIVPKNGSGQNNFLFSGAHLLVHGGETGCTETTGYAPAGAGADSCGDGSCAFNDSKAAWSPVCSDGGLSKAAAVQETLHTFIDSAYDLTNNCPEEGDDDDPYGVRQHSLGTLNYLSDFNELLCTPMLAYHWDDFDKEYESADCPCPVDLETTPDGHVASPTSCTKDSVKNTAENL